MVTFILFGNAGLLMNKEYGGFEMINAENDLKSFLVESVEVFIENILMSDTYIYKSTISIG